MTASPTKPHRPLDKRIILYGMNRKGAVSGRSHANIALLMGMLTLRQPVPRYKLASWMREDAPYGRNRKTSEILTHVKGTISALAERGVVEAAGTTIGRTGSRQDTYRLTSYGLMICYILLGTSKDKEGRKVQEELIKEFIRNACKRGNRFLDFDFDVMLNQLNQGDLERMWQFLEICFQDHLRDDVMPPLPGWTRYIGHTWASFMSMVEDPGYSGAVIEVFRALPDQEKNSMLTYLKARIEASYLLGGPPNEPYVLAVGKGGPLVHVPTWCPKCKFRGVAAKNVMKWYEDARTGNRDKCPKCGSILGKLRWRPWSAQGGGGVWRSRVRSADE